MLVKAVTGGLSREGGSARARNRRRWVIVRSWCWDGRGVGRRVRYCGSGGGGVRRQRMGRWGLGAR